MLLVHKRNLPNERPLRSAKLVSTFAGRGCRVVSQRSPTAVNLRFLFVMSLRGPRFRLLSSQKIWKRQETNPEPRDVQAETLTTRAQRLS